MKPKIKLIGRDGNAFAILGACRKTAKKAGWPEEKIKEFIDKATIGDYNKLLVVVQDYFEVE